MKKGKEIKPHIGIYGRRNYGKSSFINCITRQATAIVSNVAGTTTDPVKKSYEITGFGPVILVDTAGIDDEGDLGKQRIDKTLDTVKLIDLAILVITENNFGDFENLLVKEFKSYKTPFIIVHNKSDLVLLEKNFKQKLEKEHNTYVVEFSSLNCNNLEEVIKTIQKAIPDSSYKQPSLIGDLINYGDIVLLITPIDLEAPAGRLILPQVQMIRDVLDNDAVAIVLKEREVDAFLRKTGIKPDLAITDSSIFLKADASVPKDIPLTGFSVVLARLKGNFDKYLEGTPKIDNLKDGDNVLLLESCTHHLSCEDIGRVKIPRWLTNYSGKNLNFDVVSGLDNLKRPITDYSLVIQCGGCMITSKQLVNRLKPAIDNGIPVTNYGMTIAYVQGVFNRAIEPFVKNKNIDYL
ncbi:MAG: [FeFe] hydrogenase H-cluster maturation GTPase HydF [Bacteroidales bacterium]|nr:[FeFe] hydrogenase H-cluster maturation GTPase HydF [Bacteroidales bacterium]